MTQRRVRRTAVLLLATLVVGVTGCDMVRAGAKCRAGSPPGRDATHVLFCQNGKWNRVMTIGQAAEFITSAWPTNVELISGGGGESAGVGEAFSQVSVRVTRKDGSVVQGADVVFSGPASGASIVPSGLVGTDANGIARFTPVANGTLGGYPVTATVNGGYSPYVTFGLNNIAASASSITVVSGNDQVATAGTQFANPIVVKAVDRFGNTVTNKNFEFTTTAPGVWFGPAQAFAGDNGLATTTIGTGNVSGPLTITAKVVGSTTTRTFYLHVKAGPIVHGFDFFSGDGQTANSSSDPQFPNRVNNPLNVGMIDTFGNPVVDQAVVYTITPGGGASGTFDTTGTTSATFLSESDGIAKARLHGNGVSGSFTVTATFDGVQRMFTVTNP